VSRSTGHIWACKVIVKDFSTIIIKVTRSRHEARTYANTHVRTHVFLLTFRAEIPAKIVVVTSVALDSVT
jgi:hypothetical protein